MNSLPRFFGGLTRILFRSLNKSVFICIISIIRVPKCHPCSNRFYLCPSPEKSGQAVTSVSSEFQSFLSVPIRNICVICVPFLIRVPILFICVHSYTVNILMAYCKINHNSKVTLNSSPISSKRILFFNLLASAITLGNPLPKVSISRRTTINFVNS